MRFNAIATLHVRSCSWEQKNQMATVAITTLQPVWNHFSVQEVELSARENKDGDVHIGHWVIE